MATALKNCASQLAGSLAFKAASKLLVGRQSENAHFAGARAISGGDSGFLKISLAEGGLIFGGIGIVRRTLFEFFEGMVQLAGVPQLFQHRLSFAERRIA